MYYTASARRFQYANRDFLQSAPHFLPLSPIETHNPKVGSSNLPPATTKRQGTPFGVPCFFVAVWLEWELLKWRQPFLRFCAWCTYDKHPLGAKPKFRIFLPQPQKERHTNRCVFSFCCCELAMMDLENAPAFSQVLRLVHLRFALARRKTKVQNLPPATTKRETHQPVCLFFLPLWINDDGLGKCGSIFKVLRLMHLRQSTHSAQNQSSEFSSRNQIEKRWNPSNSSIFSYYFAFRCSRK